MSRAAVIFSGGNPLPRSPLGLIADGAFIIAADSGLHAASGLELHIDLVVGDLDSADPGAVAAARVAGAAVEEHPSDKNATDLELALVAAAERGLAPVRVIGGSSLERIDHFIANALLLTADRFAHLSLDWWVEGARVVIVRDVARLSGEPGDIVTLLAVGSPALGVTTGGLHWPLTREVLEPASTRGVSNLMTKANATISIKDGTIMAIHTGNPRP